MSKPIKKISPEQQARIDAAVASVRKRTRPQPKNDNQDQKAAGSPPTAEVPPLPAIPNAQDVAPSSKADTGEGIGGTLSKRGNLKRKTKSASSEYEVGYGKPPKSGQFKKGSSGNMKGRPKASRNTRTIIHEALFKTREVTLEGKKVRMSQFEIGIQQVMNKFMTGDAKAAAQVLALLAKFQELGGSVTGDDQTPNALPITESSKRMIARSQADLFRTAGVSPEQIAQLLESLGLPPVEDDVANGIKPDDASVDEEDDADGDWDDAEGDEPDDQPI